MSSPVFRSPTDDGKSARSSPRCATAQELGRGATSTGGGRSVKAIHLKHGMSVDTKDANRRFNMRRYCPLSIESDPDDDEGQRTPTSRDFAPAEARCAQNVGLKIDLAASPCKGVQVTETTIDIDLDRRSSNASTASTSTTTPFLTSTSTSGRSSLSGEGQIRQMLTLDTAMLSATSTNCSIGSSISAVSSASSSDIYGWEEELDRRSAESPRTPPWEQTAHNNNTKANRRSLQASRFCDGGKRKSLLQRVLHLKVKDGRCGGLSVDNSPCTPGLPREWRESLRSVSPPPTQLPSPHTLDECV